MIRHFRQVIILLSLLFITSKDALAQESMLPEVSYSYLEQLITIAKANYPKMRQYNRRIKIAEIGVQKAKLSWFDIVTLTYLYSPTNSTTTVNPTYSSGYQVGAYVNIASLLQKKPAIKQAQEELKIAKDIFDEYNLNIEAEVKQRYFNYIRNLTILNIRTKNAEDVESSVKQIKFKFEKGEETLENYNRTLTLYANALQTKVEAEGAVLVSKTALEELLGEDLDHVKSSE